MALRVGKIETGFRLLAPKSSLPFGTKGVRLDLLQLRTKEIALERIFNSKMTGPYVLGSSGESPRRSRSTLLAGGRTPSAIAV